MIKIVLHNDSDFFCRLCGEKHKLDSKGKVDNPRVNFVASSTANTANDYITDEQAEQMGANMCLISKVQLLEIREYYKHD